MIFVVAAVAAVVGVFATAVDVEGGCGAVGNGSTVRIIRIQ